MQNWSVRERFLTTSFCVTGTKTRCTYASMSPRLQLFVIGKTGAQLGAPFQAFPYHDVRFHERPFTSISHWSLSKQCEKRAGFFFYTCVCLIVLEIPRRDVTYTLYRLIYTGTYTLLGRDTGTYVAIVHVRYVLTFNTICVRIYIFK